MVVSLLFSFFILLICVGIIILPFLSHKRVIDRNHANQNSYQKYAKFYGEYVPDDKDFDRKLNKICVLITYSKMTDIKKISEMSQCSVPECILKIRYLKNKRYIGDYYIDTVHLQLLPCGKEDQLLLEKYKPFVYGSHLQIDDIANVINNPNKLTIKELRNKVYQEIKYLYDKGLINGIKLDTVDHKILYYSVEKRKIYSDMESIHCPNCGALNDVDIRGKTRCGYCQSIIRGRESMEEGI